ncbi:hypothetical protein MYSTI_07920 [Myxococcus stipitatus DSM 14675]|uniref:Uncharacterized protein n=1 Tax=Myxococcus stipitatus (strain DSM 14675 / JCM 12634 / Mx s8) TaxID=1278073 RepID=L7UNM8_MYXSD|nr:hypothetical protein MYSTI_07920 [Myxococcus stipitatus DSM 14675]
MLNAFRHHGEPRSMIIKKAKIGVIVLNAFRHHGEPRPASPAWVPSTCRCSTPSGITASHGGAVQARRSLVNGCSTPSGITASHG